MSKTPPNWCIYDKSKKKKLEKSFQHQFPFLGKPSFYHPILDLYTSTNLHTVVRILPSQIGHGGIRLSESLGLLT